MSKDHMPAPAQGAFHSQLVEFFKWAMREGPWDGCDLDGGGIQDKAEALGLIVKTQYDPEKHGLQCDFETGDDYFEYAPELRAAQPPAAPVETDCDTVKHMWSQVDKARKEGTFSSPHQSSSAATSEAGDPIRWIKDTYLMWLKGDLEPAHMRRGQEFFDKRYPAPAQAAGMRREEAIAEAYRRFPDVVEPIPEHPKGRIAVDHGNIRYAFVEGALYAAQPPAAPVETTRLDVAKAIDPGAAWGMAVERDSPANERILQALAKADAALAVSRSSTGAAANRHLIDFISEKIGLPHNEEPSCDNFLAWLVAGEPQKARLFLKISSAIYQLNRAEQSTTDEVVRRHLREIITWLKEE